jgi:methylthioribulose-1-phosphate dehydratase
MREEDIIGLARRLQASRIIKSMRRATKRPKLKTRSHKPDMGAGVTAHALAEVGRRFHARGWALGTSGNYSAVVSPKPLRLAITASGLSKRELVASQILVCGEDGHPVEPGGGKPSAETLLHLEVIRRRGAGAVLDTQYVWSTMLSERHAKAGGLSITGFEMLKGLDGVRSHEHREWIPILGNDQDIARLSAEVARALDGHAAAHAFLLRRHGLYTWGRTLADAERHVEILEFLFEVLAREE